MRRRRHTIRTVLTAIGLATGVAAVASPGPAVAGPASGATESWAGPTSALFRSPVRDGSTVQLGVADPAASDGRAASLTIPAGIGTGPGVGAQVQSAATYLYGRFTSRVRTANCSARPSTGAVTGVFTYGNDGADHDGDGLTDNSELDVEVLCARPWEVQLTIWTDYRESDEAQQRVTRVVDLRTGAVVSTCYLTSFVGPCGVVSPAERSPARVTATPGLDTSTGYHDYRIDWRADEVAFSTSVNGRDVVLWDYRGPAVRIPHLAGGYYVNLWHTANWTPAGLPTATATPVAPLTASVDTSTITVGAPVGAAGTARAAMTAIR